MPAKRGTSTTKSRARTTATPKNAQAKVPQRSAKQPQKGLSSMANDIVGVILAVLGIALLVSLVVPTSAVVTSTVKGFLVLCFGIGAPIVPIALIVFSATFFTGEEGPVGWRVAVGLLLVVIAILALLSINVEGAEANPSLVLEAECASSAGGYLGGIVAMPLLHLMGRVVGDIVAVGVAVAGAVVCGFSISDWVSDVRAKAVSAAEHARAQAEERRAQRIIDAAADEDILRAERANVKSQTSSAPKDKASSTPSLFDETGEAETTFIGARKTSVLRRGGTAATTKVEQKTKIIPIEDPKTVVVAVEDEDAETIQTPGSVPEFLANNNSSVASSQKTTRLTKKSAPSKSKAAPTITRPGDSDGTYLLPPASILHVSSKTSATRTTDAELALVSDRLQATLEEFGLTSRVVGWIAGPSVTTYKVSMGEGERVSKIVNLEDDIALSLAAKSVRIFAPIPGTSLVGIEIPNDKPQPVYLSDVLPQAKGGPLECAFGRDSEGRPIVVDLAGLPHLLVAGTTGSGKSVLLNSIVMSILMRSTPTQVRLIMVDPKRVEFTGYAGLPHLYVPVVTEPRQAASALQWGVTEMERRLKVFEHYKVRDIRTYNANVDGGKYDELENPPKHIPYFVIIIDELADLMIAAGKDVEASIVRIAQLGRAAGIHLIVATQRPSADVVTGLIRANIDNRVALSVDNALNSRIILDQKGAEQLLGKGDMLIKLRGKKPRRAQGCMVTDDEIDKTVAFIRNQVVADYHEDILTAVVPNTPGGPVESGAARDDDPLIWEAAQIVVDSQLGSTSGLQRALSVGYARAGRIMDMLEAKGIVGPANGSKPREVLIDADDLEDLRVQESMYREVE